MEMGWGGVCMGEGVLLGLRGVGCRGGGWGFGGIWYGDRVIVGGG